MRMRITFFNLVERDFLKLIIDLPYDEMMARAIGYWKRKEDWLFITEGFSTGLWKGKEEVFSDDVIRYGGHCYLLRLEKGVWRIENGVEIFDMRDVLEDCEVLR
jgi:hypothetical protein